MKSLQNDAKARWHMFMLIFVLFLQLPLMGFALFLMVAAIVAHGTTGDILNRLIIAAICTTPLILWGWGFRVLSGLRDGFFIPARKRLLVYYTSLMVYCSLWACPSVYHNGNSFEITDLFGIMIIVGVLSIPIFATLFTKPNQAEQVTSEDLV